MVKDNPPQLFATSLAERQRSSWGPKGRLGEARGKWGLAATSASYGSQRALARMVGFAGFACLEQMFVCLLKKLAWCAAIYNQEFPGQWRAMPRIAVFARIVCVCIVFVFVCLPNSTANVCERSSPGLHSGPRYGRGTACVPSHQQKLAPVQCLPNDFTCLCWSNVYV